MSDNQRHGGRAFGLALLHVRFQLLNQPVGVRLDGVHRLPEQPGRFALEAAAGAAEIKINGVNHKTALVAGGPDGGFQPGCAGLLDGPEFVTARAVGGGEAVRGRGDLLPARPGGVLAHGRGLGLEGLQQGLKVGG